jgi:hypothetical protein
MVLSAIVFGTLLTLGPDWAIIDLPYPEVARQGVTPSVEDKVAQAVADHVHARDPKRPNRRLLLSNLKITGEKAVVRVTDGDRTETMWLTQKDGAWRVER